MSAQIRAANGSVPPGGLHESVYVSTCSRGAAFGATRYAKRFTVTEIRLLPSPPAVPATPTSSTSMQPSTVTRLIALDYTTLPRPFHAGRAGFLDSS